MSYLSAFALAFFVEGVIILFVAGLLTVLNRSLGYDYQKYWALSWFCLAGYLAIAGANLYAHSVSFDMEGWEVPLSIISSSFGYLKVYFLIVGTLIICQSLQTNSSFHTQRVLAIILFSAVLVLLFQDAEIGVVKYIAWVALLYFVTSIAHIYCAFLVYKHVRNKKGVVLFASCLAISGLMQQIFVWHSVNMIMGIPLGTWPLYYTIADSFVQSAMAFGLVSWAVANEHEKVSRTEEKLKLMALQDSLTSLPNRLWLERNFSQYLTQLLDEGKKAAFLFVDLDGFKIVNDTLGHRVGDVVLQNVSGKLRAAANQSDMICRLGGDEFVWVMPTDDDRAAVYKKADQFRLAIEGIDRIDNHPISISCSIGMSWCPEQGTDLEELTRQSDKAMYEAKRAGKNKIVIVK